MKTKRLSILCCCFLLPLGFLERDSKDRFLFAGAMYFTYDPNPRIYMGASDEPVAEDLERNSVAWLYKLAADP